MNVRVYVCGLSCFLHFAVCPERLQLWALYALGLGCKKLFEILPTILTCSTALPVCLHAQLSILLTTAPPFPSGCQLPKVGFNVNSIATRLVLLFQLVPSWFAYLCIFRINF